LNHRKAIHVEGESLAPKPSKVRRVDEKFVISELPEKEQELWLDLQGSFSLHFFTSKDVMTCCELDDLVVTLYQKKISASKEPTKQQIRAVVPFTGFDLIVGSSTPREFFHLDQAKGAQPRLGRLWS